MSEEKKNLHKSRSVQLGQGDCFSDYNCSACGLFIIANAVVPTGSMETTIPAGSRIMGLRLYQRF